MASWKREVAHAQLVRRRGSSEKTKMKAASSRDCGTGDRKESEEKETGHGGYRAS